MPLKIFDTTLRDGSQSPDVNYTIRDKIKIASALDSFGVDYIELGWPGSNLKDREAFKEASLLGFKNKVVAFGSTRRKGIKPEEDGNLKEIIESKAKAACIFGKTWLTHIEKQLMITPEENLASIKESISFLKKKRLSVFYDLEHFFDGFKDNKKYALECIKTAAAAGADYLVMCDTNGGCLPDEISLIIKETKAYMARNRIKTELGIHCHNDSGMAVPNTLAAIELGVTQLHMTVNGFGERTGNADLCLILPILIIKKRIKMPKIKLDKLTELSKIVYELANLKPNDHQPFVGKNAFRHKGGVHVDALMKGASYEHMNPLLVGNKQSIVLSELSGKANIVEIAKKYGYDVNKEDIRVKEMLAKVEEMEKKGYDIGDIPAEQYLLVERFFGKKKEIFKINTWRIMSEHRNGEYSECVITGSVDDKQREVVAPVNGGPVDAVYRSLQKMIATNYKEIKEVTLVDYKVMIAEESGAGSSVRVYVEFKHNDEEWGCVGVSGNILEASLMAIEKGFKYFMLRNF